MLLNLRSPTKLSGFYVVYNGSAQNETAGFRGVSHLLEHLIHNMNKPIYDKFEKYAIDHNAYTTKTNVVFHITGIDKIIDKFKYIFLNNISNFNVDEKTFNNERNIVIQEYLNYFNQQPVAHHENILRKYLNNYGELGVIKDLKNLTYKKCKQFYEQFFKYPTSIINVSKNYPFTEEIDFLPKAEYNAVEWDDNNQEFKYEGNGNFPKSSVICLSKNIIIDDFAYVIFITIMLGYGLNSPLYKIIREKYGLVYNLSFDLEPITNDSGIIIFCTETDNVKSANKIQKILNYVLINPEKYLTKERFDTYKQLFRIEKEKDKVNRFANVQQYMYDKDWDINNYLDNMTLEKILKIYKKYFNNWHFSIDEIEFS